MKWILIAYCIQGMMGWIQHHPTRMRIHKKIQCNNQGPHEEKPRKKNYPLSKKYYEENLKKIENKNPVGKQENTEDLDLSLPIPIPIPNPSSPPRIKKNYPFSQQYYENFVKRLNQKNQTIIEEEKETEDEDRNKRRTNYRIVISSNEMVTPYIELKSKKSENFEITKEKEKNFTSVGGYENIKEELKQCIDMLQNYTKYSKYNVRIPKGLILEGPPGNGKTLLAKAFAGEANASFVCVSGSEFQDKYIGVGSSKIRELFKLAKDNAPCVIFIDEIDALGRKRGTDAETATAERDNTLNELLVGLDGFKTSHGIFVIGATNRIDLLDPALLRPGRIDKKIYIGNPDKNTRRAILQIHSQGKPKTKDVDEEMIVEITAGYSGAQIENILNEAMLHALRNHREEYNTEDIDKTINKMIAGWQPVEHQFTNDIIDHIAIHEMGHALVGLLCSHHSKVTKVIINLSSPTSPGYTMFESSPNTIFTREALFEHLMILLSGRIAEEAVYGVSVTTGAISDFEEAFALAHKMITYYGMGKMAIYPNGSEKYKEIIDNEISKLITDAYNYAEYIIDLSTDFIVECANQLKEKKTIHADELHELITAKYKYMEDLRT